MTTIAHISDLHLVERARPARRVTSRLRLSMLTVGRRLDANERRQRCVRALRQAHRSGADHLVITGDLTEDGLDEEFELVAEVLAESPWRSDAVTLVPGNHDAYTDGTAFTRALAGPLSRFRRTSRAGAVLVVGDAVIVAVHTAFKQSVGRASGRMGADQLAELSAISAAPNTRDRALVFVQHHGPIARRLSPLEWMDGLAEREELRRLLSCRPNAHVLCGHTHGSSDHSLRFDEDPCIFTAGAVVETDEDPVRLYEVRGCRLQPRGGAPMARLAGRAILRTLSRGGAEALC